MMTTLTPDQVLQRRREVLVQQDIDGFVALFAPDAVLEMPFAGSAVPSRLEGRQAISEFSARSVAPGIRIDDLQHLAVHHTDDPEVVIVEVLAKATLTSTGQAFSGTSVQVFRIRDGQIVLFRDYFNPHGLEDLLTPPTAG